MKPTTKLRLDAFKKRASIVIPLVQPEDSRRYLEYKFNEVISFLELRPLAASIRLAEKELDQVVEFNLSPSDQAQVSHLMTSPTYKEIIKEIISRERIVSIEEFEAVSEYLSAVDNRLSDEKAYQKLGEMLVSYETQWPRKGGQDGMALS